MSHQLANTLRRLIVEGIWIRGDKIPGSRTIATDARVSRNTVNAALEILTNEGMLESRGRAGLFVVWKHVPGENRREFAAAVDVAAYRPLSFEALPLDLFPLDTWKRLQSRYWNRASALSLDHGSHLGERSLREAIAVLVNVTAGISCNAEQIIVVGGLRDALALCKAVLGELHAAAWIEDPTHNRTRFALRAAGIEAIPIPVDAQGMSIETASEIDGKARLAVVRPAFQFPTGAMLSPARARMLIEWAKAHDTLVVEDATESEFAFSKRSVRSLATLDRAHVVHFNSFERSLFPATGLAYLIAPERLVDAFHRSRGALEVQAQISTQVVLAEFINSGHFAKYVRKCREIVEERHSALLEGLARLSPTLSFERQLGGLHVCARLFSPEGDALLSQRAAAVGVDTAPLSATYARKPAVQGLVMGFAAFDRHAISDAVNALERILLPVPTSSAISA